MHFSRACLGPVCYELGQEIVTNADIEQDLETAMRQLRIPKGHIGELTGIMERRFWSKGSRLSVDAARSARDLLQKWEISPNKIDLLSYTSVCREYFEPATAVLVAKELRLSSHAKLYDVSNACLGFLDGILQAAAQVELGWIKLALVVACESSRDILQIAIQKLKLQPSFPNFAKTIATLTGGSGAAACLVGDRATLQSLNISPSPLLTAVWQNNHAHAELCRWGVESPNAAAAADAQQGNLDQRREYMETDGVEVLKHGMTLGKETWQVFKDVYPWREGKPQKIITHQVGGAHRQQMLHAFGMSEAADFPTYAKLGNMGTASIPISFAMAAQAQHFVPADEIGLLGIGSGLTTLMLGVEWQPLSQ